MFSCALFYVHSNFATILLGKRKLVALLVFLVSRDCCVALPCGALGLCVCLQFMIVVKLTYFF